MKIYFAGSIRAGRDDQELYQRLIQSLQYLWTGFDRTRGDPNLTQWGDEGPADRDIYERDTAWLADADVVVAEVSTPRWVWDTS